MEPLENCQNDFGSPQVENPLSAVVIAITVIDTDGHPGLTRIGDAIPKQANPKSSSRIE